MVGLGFGLGMAVLVGIFVLAPGCKGKTDVSFEIALPRALVQTTAWFEVGAFRDASCGALRPMLLNGVPDGSSKRLAFLRRDATAPRVGDLAAWKYAFVAVAKGDDCAVLATGCAEAEMRSDDKVAIPMDTNDPPTGACGLGSSSQAARCVPANDNSDPSVGSRCSLELLGAGPLANPVGGGGTLVSAPAIAATPSGFVIVSREIDPKGASARVTVLPIDPGGGALNPTRPLLKGRCANSDETDGIGLVMNGSDGNIVLARSACGDTPALERLSFTTKPEVAIDPNFISSPAPAQKLTLSNAHVAATRPGGSVVAFLENGAALLSTVKPGSGVVAPSGTFGGTASMTGAWVAASDRVLAVLGAGPAGDATPGGTDAGGGGTGGGDTGSTLRLVITPPRPPPTSSVPTAGRARPSCFQANGARSQRSADASSCSATAAVPGARSPPERSISTRPRPRIQTASRWRAAVRPPRATSPCSTTRRTSRC